MLLTLTATANDDGRRLDRILRKALRELPLSAIHRLIRKGAVLVDGKKAAPDYLIHSGQTIMVNLSTAVISDPAPGREFARDQSKLEILYESSEVLILNKPAGITVHGRGSDGAFSLESQVLSYLRPKLKPSLSFRPGPLHRLDKQSSGIIVFSASLEGARIVSAMIRERRIGKFYLAIVEGKVEKPGVWKDELTRDHKKGKSSVEKAGRNFRGIIPDGPAKTALTKIHPVAVKSGCTLILAEIITGRTHQIRAQAAEHGHPLLGDRKYGGRPIPGASQGSEDSGFLLHAWRLEFPEDAAFPRVLEAPLPERFRQKIRDYFGENFSLPF